MPCTIFGAVPLPDERYPPGQRAFRLFTVADTHKCDECLDAFGHRPQALTMADDVAVAVDQIVNAARVAIAAPAVSPMDERGARRAIRRQSRDVGIFVHQPVPFV